MHPLPSITASPSDRPGLPASPARRACLALWPALPLLALGGCASPQAADPVAARLRQGVVLARGLPDQVPAKSSPFPHAQFLLVAAENAAELLNPIPFVSDMVTDAVHKSAAAAFEARYASVHPYLQAEVALRGSPVLAAGDSPNRLQPFVVIQECLDGRYRLALVFHVQGADWQARYTAHLPGTPAVGAFKAPSPALLQGLNRELADAARALRGLLERAWRDELQASGARAKVASLHLVGNRAMGVMPTERLQAEAQIVDDGDTLVLRIAGDPTAPATAGGLFYGVHLFRRDQLQVFQRL